MIHNRLKFTSLLLVSSWLRARVLDWRLSQPGFNPSYRNLVCLATLLSSDRTKQICLWMTIYCNLLYSPVFFRISTIFLVFPWKISVRFLTLKCLFLKRTFILRLSRRICFTVIIVLHVHFRGASGVMVIVVKNGHGDTSSNPGRDWLHFT